MRQRRFFTTPHFDGHNSVLVQTSRLGEITRQELSELVQDAWLAQASARRRAAWLAAHGTTPISDPNPTDGGLRTLSRSRANRGRARRDGPDGRRT